MTSTSETSCVTPLRPLFLIPARGGSKGIPHKNVKPFCGRPLLSYVAATAQECCHRLGLPPEHIVLSTEDEEIVAVGAACGLPTFYRRPEELAQDATGAREVMLHAMDWAQSRGIDYDCVVYLQPTSPLRTTDDVMEALALYGKEMPRPDMVVSVNPAPCNPYYDCFEPQADGSLQVSKGDGLLTRRQQAPPAYQYNGAVYVIRPQALRDHPFGALPRRLPYVMPAERSLDLDTPLDWLIAEAVMKQSL